MLDPRLLEEVLERALRRGGEFADIFVEERARTNIHFSSNAVERAIVGTDAGAGIRVFSRNRSYYAHTSSLVPDSLRDAADGVAQAVSEEVASSPRGLVPQVVPNRHPAEIPPGAVEAAGKIELVRRANAAARSVHELITQVELTYMDEHQRVCIANTDGLLVEDTRVRTRLYMATVASDGSEMQVGTVGPGACRGFEFYETIDVEGLARETAETAVNILRADYVPGGAMPVIIDRGFGGVIFHEACGHGLEAYHVAQRASIFADKMGQRVASELVSVVDDGTLPNQWGSTNVDDEGAPTQRTVLIDRGVLRSYMVDRLSGEKLRLRSTGSGRRESYRFAPVSRMRNTFILPGESKLEEMIAATERGIYARKMGGGSVEPSTGEFNFAVQEGYLIEGGRILRPVRGATLIGNGSDVLRRIDMVADNLEFAQGMCGAASGHVPTDVGQPAIRVRELIVGGR